MKSPECFKLFHRFTHGQEDLRIEELVSQLSVERLDMAALGRLAGTNEVQLDPVTLERFKKTCTLPGGVLESWDEGTVDGSTGADSSIS